jgi:hypothetical protein
VGDICRRGRANEGDEGEGIWMMGFKNEIE